MENLLYNLNLYVIIGIILVIIIAVILAVLYNRNRKRERNKQLRKPMVLDKRFESENNMRGTNRSSSPVNPKNKPNFIKKHNKYLDM